MNSTSKIQKHSLSASILFMLILVMSSMLMSSCSSSTEVVKGTPGINLTDFIGAGATTNTNVQIWVQVVFFLHQGNGEFNVIESSAIQFTGNIKLEPFYEGDLSLSIKVLNPTNMNIVINGNKAEAVTYRVQGDHLIIDATFPGNKKEQIDIYRQGKETYLGLSGFVNAAIHLNPGPK